MSTLAPRPARPAETKVRAVRYHVHGDLLVASKTIGTSTSYKLSMEDVSRSGLLLQWIQKIHVPFIENTIIEMTIDPERRWLKEPVSCLGKVVRRVERSLPGSDARHTEFGVHIVQIDNNDLTIWDTCLAELAQKAEKLVAV